MEEKVIKYLSLFLFGGFLYYYAEILYRGYSHVSMIICGGVCFVFCGMINRGRVRLTLLEHMFLSGIIFTLVEFLTGVIVNRWMKLDVWDYSNVPYQLMGQICLSYSVLWFFLSGICIVCNDLIRCLIFDEDTMRERWFLIEKSERMK